MRKKIPIIVFLLTNLAAVTLGQVAAGGGFSVEKSSVAGGGKKSSAGSFELVGTIGQGAAGADGSGSPFDHRIGFWVPDQLAPTAATATVSGKVLMANGAGIRNVRVTLTDIGGVVRTTTTASLGAFVFTDVEVGQTYVVTVSSNRFGFSNPSRVISVDDNVSDINIVADGVN